VAINTVWLPRFNRQRHITARIACEFALNTYWVCAAIYLTYPLYRRVTGGLNRATRSPS
jgi:hypothetical protein